MSLLPQYRKDEKNLEETVPLWSADQDATLTSHDDPAPAYPPRTGGSSGTATHNVTYTFVPRWPIKGSQQDALGVLGDTKEETIAIVQRGMPVLAEFPPERIEFLSLVEEGRPNGERWGKILDEAWPTFRHSPPTRLRVQVADLPGDEARRKAREIRWLVAFIVAICSPFLLVLVLLMIGVVQ